MSTLKRHQVSLPGGGTDLAASRRLSPLPLLSSYFRSQEEKEKQKANKQNSLNKTTD